MSALERESRHRQHDEVSVQDRSDLSLQLETIRIEADCLGRTLAERSARVAQQDAEIAALAAERDALRRQLRAIVSSTSWRATAPLRNALGRFPVAALWTGRALKLAWWTLTFQLGSRRRAWRKSREALRASPPDRPPLLQEPARPTDVPPGWYGARRLRPDELSSLGRMASPGPGVFERQTAAISHRYKHAVHDDGSGLLYRQMGSTGLARDRLQGVSVPEHVAPSESPAGYSIVTPYYRHTEFFRLCVSSVAALAASSPGGEGRLEWIVLNDDPAMTGPGLQALLPPALQGQTRLLSDGRNLGIVRRLTQGIAAARFPWILFLDCDDEIAPEAIQVLDHYIGLFPRCRYIASTMIDIDESGQDLRPRIHEHPTTELFEHGMVASHLKAIRRDLIDELGGFNPSLAGVQDYDLALRAAAREPLLQIPEHLYRYRWHEQSQTVARQARQAWLARAARAYFLRDLMNVPSAEVRQTETERMEPEVRRP